MFAPVVCGGDLFHEPPRGRHEGPDPKETPGALSNEFLPFSEF